ncbi:SDR family oxidoreductase [Winogradskya consettensis]|uniref:Oxidoreductase n=1 Tax=Winogradskya consettensis TaxID=113560 RepID=A0A919VYU4_9ACTN|nr:SDR family oxidoreductase [Actinoplanes consettensis]GIM83601.1 oxidoreductase [Actinoplanes consettensis]
MTKVIAVTGASSGIGEATALRLAEAGHRLVLGARREDRLADLAARIGDQAVMLRTDVRRRADMAGLVALAQERFGRLDVLVGNAGVGIVAPLDDLGVEDWEDMIDVNIKGFLYGVAAALPVFRAQGSGHFVTTLSTAGLKVVPGMAVYAGTKNAVRTMSEGLRQEAGAGLRVTTVSPGVTATDFVSSSIAAPEVRASYEAMAISPDAIARAVEFAIDQPADVDVNEIVVRPTAQA